jgi:hypothetical protein
MTYDNSLQFSASDEFFQGLADTNKPIDRPTFLLVKAGGHAVTSQA